MSAQRVKAFENKPYELTIYACDDGVKESWLELEVPGQEPLKLTRNQANALESNPLIHAALSLRSEAQLAHLNGRITSLDGLQRAVAVIHEERNKEAEPKTPTLEEQMQARERRDSRIRAISVELESAERSVGTTRRHEMIMKSLEKELAEARELGTGLDLSSMEEELEKTKRFASFLPERLAKVDELKAELKEAYAWDGYED